MKKIILIIISLLLIGCGSSNNSDKYTVTDDGNGTHNPRISKVLVTTYDDNTTVEKYSINYSYNELNLLIEKKEIHKNSDGYEPTISYKYNNLKQNIDIGRSETMFAGSYNAFSYADDIIYTKTKLPIISSSEYMFVVHVSTRTFQIDYEYEYNDKGEVKQLKSSQDILIGSTMPVDRDLMGTIYKSTQYIYDENGRIMQEISRDGIKKYIYNSFGKLSAENVNGDSRVEYFYNEKLLLISSKKYDMNKRLVETKKYIYENKPYYSNPSPNHLDQGQYSFSGIY